MLAYAVSVAPLLQFFVQQTTEVENYVNTIFLFSCFTLVEHKFYDVRKRIINIFDVN